MGSFNLKSTSLLHVVNDITSHCHITMTLLHGVNNITS